MGAFRVAGCAVGCEGAGRVLEGRRVWRFCRPTQILGSGGPEERELPTFARARRLAGGLAVDIVLYAACSALETSWYIFPEEKVVSKRE